MWNDPPFLEQLILEKTYNQTSQINLILFFFFFFFFFFSGRTVPSFFFFTYLLQNYKAIVFPSKFEWVHNTLLFLYLKCIQKRMLKDS